MILAAKIILLPIPPIQCFDKKLLFRIGGLYHIVSVQERRIVIRLDGVSTTSEKDNFDGFLQPVAFFPELPEEERFMQFENNEDYAKCALHLEKDTFGRYILGAKAYNQNFIYLQINGDKARFPI